MPPCYGLAVFSVSGVLPVVFGGLIHSGLDFILDVPKASFEFRNPFAHAFGDIGNAFGPEQQQDDQEDQENFPRSDSTQHDSPRICDERPSSHTVTPVGEDSVAAGIRRTPVGAASPNGAVRPRVRANTAFNQ